MSTWNWLAWQRTLQEEYFGKDFPIADPDEFADYMVMMHTGAVLELGEVLGEIGWKDWAVPRGWVNRDAAVGELVDVAHFLGNMLVALGVTDAEWIQRYKAKSEVNRQRQRDGYDGVTDKCPTCRRSYDDAGVQCHPSDGIEAAWCAR